MHVEVAVDVAEEKGGIRAVIWTDFFQMFVMVLGVIIVIIVGCVLNGGFIETLYTASKGGRLDMFNMSLNPFVRHTFFNTMSFGFINFVRIYGMEQYSVQRIFSVKSVKKAKKVATFSIFGVIILLFPICFAGLVVFANYAGCDPMALGIIKKKDQIMPYFVMDKLSFIPGLQGLFFPVLFHQLMCGFALVTGAVYIGLAILASNTKGLAEITIKVAGAYSGPVVGVFLIGFFLPKCNIKGVWTGFILSYNDQKYFSSENLTTIDENSEDSESED
ncbi:Sodium-coupled monocarboxylate transporter 2 [Armadillidium nasatum]|uniref:Sodium-coupled monocarboxylate transporter 2 n=1 Tax=Armadillidium nasatum TaxID=96803 RepID=A0A5N5TC55_9CRUS|nr:Sodium-coupled monocarboxylate transporter 2 [Armadillidium nasatum]